MVEQKNITEYSVGYKKPPPGVEWEPGVSGNPAGRPKNSVTTLLKNKSPEENQKVADKLYALALEGDMSAIREYIDRTDGKVDSTLNLKGDIPVSITFIREGLTTSPNKQIEEGKT